MSAIRRCLRAGIAGVLLLSLTGCQHPSDFQRTDIPAEDTTQEEYAFETQAALGSDRILAFWEAEEDQEPELPRFWEAPDPEDTIWAITPDNRGEVWDRQEQNPDTAGWLYIPGTEVDEVVLKNPVDKSNDYYLNRSFDGGPDPNGTFCIDRRASIGSGTRGGLSRNTTIYGHSWDDDPDGTLFSQLKRYRDEDFAREHPYLFFSTGSEDMAWEVFAVFDTVTDLLYNVPNLNDNEFFDVLDIVEQASLYSYNVAVGPADKILTLSTCTFSVEGHGELPPVNNYRFVIMARLMDPDEIFADEAVFAVNGDPISPDEIGELLDGGAMRGYAFGV